MTTRQAFEIIARAVHSHANGHERLQELFEALGAIREAINRDDVAKTIFASGMVRGETPRQPRTGNDGDNVHLGPRETPAANSDK